MTPHASGLAQQADRLGKAAFTEDELNYITVFCMPMPGSVSLSMPHSQSPVLAETRHFSSNKLIMHLLKFVPLLD